MPDLTAALRPWMPTAQRPPARRRRLALAATLLAGTTLTPALAADEPSGCSLLWQLQLLPAPGAGDADTAARQLQVSLSFDAAGRSRSTLRLPAGWAALQALPAQALLPAAPALQPVPDAPDLRTVAHGPTDRVKLRWRYTGNAGVDGDGGVRLAAGWWALAGPGLLPLPDGLDERNPPSACVQLEAPGAAPGVVQRWASSLGLADGPTALFRLPLAGAPLRQRVQQALVVGGALDIAQAPAGAAPLTVVRPANAAWRFSLADLAQAGGSAWAAQRSFWGDGGQAAPLLMLLLPGATAAAGSPWHQALVLQAPPDLALPSPAADLLLQQALQRTWMHDRFGPLRHAGRQDDWLRAWFSEGWTDYYAHRLLLRSQQWTPEAYADALNVKIVRYLTTAQRPGAPTRGSAGAPLDDGLALASARGEWLALQWQAALRAAGQPGLDAVLQRLLLPLAQARHEGPISAPLATHRLVAALRPVLGDLPLRDLQHRIEQGEPFSFGPGSLGPCFVGQTQAVPGWRLGFDAASLAQRVVQGVEADGPAAAAGLRDGQRLLGAALEPGDTRQPVRLQVQDEDGTSRLISYLATGGPMLSVPQYRPVPQALQQPACQGWLGLGPEAQRASGSSVAARPVAGAADAPPCPPPGPRTAKAGLGAKAGKAGKAGKKALRASQACGGQVAQAGSKATAKAIGKSGHRVRAKAGKGGAKAIAKAPGKAAKAGPRSPAKAPRR